MSSNRDIDIAKAALEAADIWLVRFGVADVGERMRRELDPAAIAATVPQTEPQTGPYWKTEYVPLEVHERLLDELAALRRDAERWCTYLSHFAGEEGMVEAITKAIDASTAQRSVTLWDESNPPPSPPRPQE